MVEEDGVAEVNARTYPRRQYLVAHGRELGNISLTASNIPRTHTRVIRNEVTTWYSSASIRIGS